MNRARSIVSTIAIMAGALAAWPASGSDPQPVAASPARKLDIVDVPVARAATVPVQTAKPEDAWAPASPDVTLQPTTNQK